MIKISYSNINTCPVIMNQNYLFTYWYMMKANVNYRETFQSDKKYFGPTESISLSVQMTDISPDNFGRLPVLKTSSPNMFLNV